MLSKEVLKRNKLVQNIYARHRKFYAKTAVDLERVALGLRVKRGHKDYTKFVIIGCGRSGTNLLRSLLNSHSKIIAFGEIFRRYGEIGWSMPGYNKTPGELSLISSDPVQFLDKYVFRRYPIQVSAVAFKLFYYHAQNDEWRPIWSYLQNNKNIHIIHLRRKNMLATRLSKEFAFRTNLWEKRNDTVLDNPQIELDYQRLIEAFEKTREFEQRTDLAFNKHKKICITYEDLCDNNELIIKQVLDFLGLEYESTKTNLCKQNKKKLSDSISNYHALKDKFRGTSWSEYFVD